MTTAAASTPTAPADIEALVGSFTADLRRLRDEIGTMIVGQDTIIEGVLTCLLAGGHALLEGVPGLGKTCWCARWRSPCR
jgi:MoxR-like ATPase